MNDSPNSRFTGIFTPVEIMEIDELSLFEERLLSIIDSLYSKIHGGCFASNEYLAQRMKKAKVNTVVKALIKLRKLGLIEDVSFNGRQRVIRACIGKIMEKSQSQSACDLNHSLGVTKITGSIGQKSQSPHPSPYIYNKEDRKEDNKNIAQTATPLRQEATTIYFSFDKNKFENISQDDIKAWESLYGDLDITREINRMVQWILSNPSKAKAKKLWRKFITTWLQNEYEKTTNKAAYRRSMKNEVIERHTGFQHDHRPRDPRKVHDYSDWEPDESSILWKPDGKNSSKDSK